LSRIKLAPAQLRPLITRRAQRAYEQSPWLSIMQRGYRSSWGCWRSLGIIVRGASPKIGQRTAALCV